MTTTAKHFTFHIESKLGLLDTFEITAKNRSLAKKIAKRYFKETTQKNFPNFNYNLSYII